MKQFYLLKVAFGAKPIKSNFGYGTTRPSSLNILDLEESIIQIHWRLARVTVENLDYTDAIARYDRPHTFFYLDPPYYGIKAYKLNFEDEDFERLGKALIGLKGKFLMSLNDHKQVRRIFGSFKVQTTALRYSCMRKPGSRGTTRGELLISNY